MLFKIKANLYSVLYSSKVCGTGGGVAVPKNGSSIGNSLPYHLALPTPCLPYWIIREMPTDIIDCSEVWITEGPIKADKGAEGLTP
jgi:hypothetical protein